VEQKSTPLYINKYIKSKKAELILSISSA